MKSKKLTLHILRRLIFILLFFASYVLQFICLPETRFPFPVFILIPLTVAVSMFEHEFQGLFYGLLAGALWDLASPVTDGMITLLLTLAACITGLLSHYSLRCTLLSCLIFTSVISIIFSAVLLLFFVPLTEFEELRHTFLNFYLPGSIITEILTVPVYFLVRKIFISTRTEKVSN
ncbi:MAG: hypothetical protein IJO68_00605 [Clostridia bacterium]|nr:hypothetical protein [Clostridia bacterium]